MREAEEFFGSMDRIGCDNEMGAVELTLKASEVLGTAASTIRDDHTLTELLVYLLKQKPTMAPMVNLVNGALLSMEEGLPIDGFCGSFRSELQNSGRIVSEKASALIKDGFRVMTYSNSSTISDTLMKAVSEGKRLEVVLSEARPVREGRLMAKRTSDLGIPVTLVADSALFQEMEDVDIVMVGADALSHRYMVNKIGTRGLASQARLLGKDLIAVAGSDKVLPAGIENYRKVLRPTDEIMEPMEGVRIMNYYFDQTPLNLVSRIVTEKGPMGPHEIIQEAKEKKVHPFVSEFYSRGL